MTKQFVVDVKKLELVKDKSVGSGYRFKSSCPGNAGDPNLGIPASLSEVALCREVERLCEIIKRKEVVIRRHDRNARRRLERRKKKC